MSRLLPFQSETELPDDRAPRVVDLDGDDAEKVFGALSSETAREIFKSLHEEPMTASDIADAVDSSIQNVRYHLESLEEAGLVEIVDTWYSSRGNEMKVYAPRDGPLIVSSDQSTASRLRTALNRIVGGGAVLAAASFLVQWGSSAIDLGLGSSGAAEDPSSVAATDDGASVQGEPAGADGGNTTTSSGDIGIQDATTSTATDGGGTTEPTVAPQDAPTTASGDPSEYATEVARTTSEAITAASGGDGGLLQGGVPPGALFFLGGFVVLVALVAVQYHGSSYR
jgi:DNA-binding transcriptional ArsR family regulator